MKNQALRGTGVALVTPLHKDGSIDFKALGKLVNRCIDGKLEYLVPLGTTGESVTLTAAERRAVLDFVVETADGRIPVVLGLGGNNTADVLRSMEEYDFSSISAILSVSPYYNRPSQQGIVQHYKLIAAHSPVPVILYNVPARTGSTMEAATTLELAHEVKNIIGIKEASGSLERAMEIIAGRPKDFLVISGDDLLTLPILACGGDGMISVIANAFPKEAGELVRAGLAGDFSRSRKFHYPLMNITKAIFADGNPTGIKGLLTLMKVCQEHVRLPLTPVNRSMLQKLETAWKG